MAKYKLECYSLEFPSDKFLAIIGREAYKIPEICRPTYKIYKDKCIFYGYLSFSYNIIKIIYYIDNTYEKYIDKYVISKGRYISKL